MLRVLKSSQDGEDYSKRLRYFFARVFLLARHLGWGVGRPSGIGWGDNVRTAVGSSPAPPTVRVAM